VINISFWSSIMFALAKRAFLFLCVNIAVTAMLLVVLFLASNVFPALRQMDLPGIAIMAGLFGFGGAFFSLAISKWMAKRSLGVQVIDPATAQGEARWLLQTVYKLAAQAGIESMPEVGIWESPEINAFCTGPGKNNSLVAVSTGILRTMSHDELEGVLGHELTHATNGDMVTMTLIQGVVNSFVFAIAILVSRLMRSRDDDDRGMSGFFMQHMIYRLVQSVVGMVAFALIIGPFSRRREFRADAGGAQLTSKAKMIAGLQALMDQQRVPMPVQAPKDPALATLMVTGAPSSWFSTHPSLEDRIARLKEMVILR
jgi:heat shock protein HtpX